MTDNATLTRLRELLAAAQPAPWESIHIYEGHEVLRLSKDEHSPPHVGVLIHEPDAKLAVAAVNALPALLRVAEAAKRCQPTKIGHMGHCQANARLDCTCGKYENDAELSKAIAALEGGTP